MENYLHLDPYPEAREALAALAGRKLAILSNGSPRMLQKLVRNSGLNRWIEAAISVDGVRTYNIRPLRQSRLRPRGHTVNIARNTLTAQTPRGEQHESHAN
jgi:phosphoglycolate phosphatase-like HAD superfamily hydrolase